MPLELSPFPLAENNSNKFKLRINTDINLSPSSSSNSVESQPSPPAPLASPKLGHSSQSVDMSKNKRVPAWAFLTLGMMMLLFLI